MKVFHVTSAEDARQLNQWFEDGNSAFVLIYMEGCGPCNATRPEWAKMEQAMQHHNNASSNNIAIADVNKDFMADIPNIKNVSGFPTMQWISPQSVEPYENSSVRNKNRSHDSFVEWVESKTAPVESTSSPHSLFQRLKRDTFGTIKTKRKYRFHKKSHKGYKSKRGGRRKSRNKRRR